MEEKTITLVIEGFDGEEEAECVLAKSPAFEYGNGMCILIDSPSVCRANWGKALMIDARYIDLGKYPFEQICSDKLAEKGFAVKRISTAEQMPAELVVTEEMARTSSPAELGERMAAQDAWMEGHGGSAASRVLPTYRIVEAEPAAEWARKEAVGRVFATEGQAKAFLIKHNWSSVEGNGTYRKDWWDGTEYSTARVRVERCVPKLDAAHRHGLIRY